jgi:NADH-quinone oxidoreductase subunit M
MLNLIIGLPLLAALLIALIPRNYRFVIRMVALGATLVSMILGILLFLNFTTGETGIQFETNIPWVDSLGIHYHVGVDGLNIGLILMGAIVAFAAACVSWEIQSSEKLYYVLLMVMTGGILGAFASLDMFFFYFFHELALIPTFIMIGLWGRGQNKNYATFNITLYLSLGALIALFGLVALYLQMPVQERTFDMVAMTNYFKANAMSAGAQNFIFPLLMFGFGILVSLWPFHTWAPLGYGAAPTATAMLHAGVLKKFGLYGLIRIALPMMPQGAQHWLNILALLCLGNILHVGWVAMRQRDLNLLIGNSSVAHMGFVFLGIASLNIIGMTGAVMVMVAHGLLAALSFAVSGYLYQQTGNLQMNQLGGLLRKLPFIGAVMMAAMFAGCGLPGFANFAGEVLVLFGAWGGSYSSQTQWFVTATAWGALVIGGIYMLRAIRNILHGDIPEKWVGVKDATHWRKIPFALLVVSLLVFGFAPRLLTDKIKPSAQAIVNLANPKSPAATASAVPQTAGKTLVSFFSR